MTFTPGAVVHALDLPLDHEPIAPDQVRDGEPRAGWVDLGVYAGTEVGVWEMTPGTSTDMEVDELFVVIAGRAHVEFTDPRLDAIDLGPGDVVRLESGMQTIWTVTESLRMVSVA